MSRAIIGGAVTLLVLVLTGAAYFVTTSRLDSRLERDVKVRVAKAQDLLIQNSKLEGLSLLKRVEDLSRDENLLSALKAETDDVAFERAGMAFQSYRAGAGGGESIDIMALLDREGDLVVLDLQGEPTRITNPGAWKDGDRLKYRSIELALNPDPTKAHMVSDIINLEGQGLMKVGVAPVVDYDANQVAGAVVVAYVLSHEEAQQQSSMLGAEVAYFEGDRTAATSFRKAGTKLEDTPKQAQLSKALAAGLSKASLSSKSGLADPVEIEVGGERYVAAAGRLVRFSSKGFPADYPEQKVGAMVLISLDDALEPVAAAKMGILLVGIGAILIAGLALWFSGRRVTHQTDQIEMGLAEIINGNLDYSFRSVGAELDGVANGLNVMLARLLGRPEPGEEEYDENGNIVQPNRLDFDTDLSDKDEEAVRLAQEPEPDYYKRIYGEYISARGEVGLASDGVTFDGFVTKLRINESNLKARYQCSAIRFKVVVADGKVSLKPVPIV